MSKNPNYDIDKLISIINTGIKKTKNDYTNMNQTNINKNNKFLFEFVKCSLMHMQEKNDKKN